MKSNTSLLRELVWLSALLNFMVAGSLLVHELYPIYIFLIFYYLLGGARTVQFGVRMKGFVDSEGNSTGRPRLFQGLRVILIWPLVLWVWLLAWKD